MLDKKVKGNNRGEEGTTPVTTACPEAGKEDVSKNKKKILNMFFCHSSRI